LLALVHRCRNYKSSFSGYVKLLEFHSWKVLRPTALLSKLYLLFPLK
jgi:hypothetical protein